MWTFIKNFAISLYRQTVGGLVRLVKHTCRAEVDDEDKRYLARLLMYVSFGILSWFFPLYAVALLGLRIMVYGDVFGTAAVAFQQAANSFKESIDAPA